MQKGAKANVLPIRQQTQYNCMTTSLAMALKALGVPEGECTIERVNRVVGAMPLHGAAWEPLLAAAQHYGMRATLTLPSTVRQIKAWTDAGSPVVIAWNPEGREWSHASLVFDVVEDPEHGHLIYIADPNIPDPDETVRVVPKKEFYAKWYEKSPQGFLIRRPACVIEREITPDGRQVVAMQKSAALPDGWKQIDSKGTYRYKSPTILIHLVKGTRTEYVKSRDIPSWQELTNDGEMFADGVPELVEQGNSIVRQWEEWTRQGWWPQPVQVPAYRAYVAMLQTRHTFKAEFETATEAIRKLTEILPKLEKRIRPRWLVPDDESAEILKDRNRFASVVASRYIRAQSAQKLEPQTRQSVNKRLIAVGLDGNGRFTKPEHGYMRAVDVLAEFGIELDEVVNSFSFKPPSNQFSVHLAYTNREDLFSPIEIRNSKLAIHYTEVSPGRFEVLAYLS